MSKCDITVVMNAHREGLVSHSSMLSIEQAVAQAEREGIRTEVVIVLDRSDEQTDETVASFCNRRPFARVLKVDNGDLGLSRNSGIAAAEGKWIAFLDADDLWGANWLASAYAAAKNDTRSIVWHPEINVYFGSHPHLFLHVDMEDPHYEHAGLAITNYWTALCFAPRQLFLDIPYRHTDMKSQIGYEDWSWNMETISRGWLHKLVPGTGHAIRMKEVSLLRQTSAANCLPHPSDLFRQMLLGEKPASR